MVDTDLLSVCQSVLDTDLQTVNMWWTQACRLSTCGGHGPTDCQHVVDTDLQTVCQLVVDTDLLSVCQHAVDTRFQGFQGFIELLAPGG